MTRQKNCSDSEAVPDVLKMTEGKNSRKFPRLKESEAAFCRFYAFCGNVEEAASKTAPANCADALQWGFATLERPGAIQLVERLQKILESSQRQLVKTALLRAVFGNAADALRLSVAENPETLPLHRMDLFQIAEVKRPKSGGMEIRLLDRLDAIRLLMEAQAQEVRSSGLDDLLHALEPDASPSLETPVEEV